MKQRTLGDGLTVSAIGLGCMSLTGAYDAASPDRGNGIAVILGAIAVAMSFGAMKLSERAKH